MATKTLLSVVTRQDDASPGMAALDAAIALARREDAHLEVLALGMDQTQVGYFYAGASAIVYQETLERAQADAEAAEAMVRKRLAAEDIRWSVDRAVAQLGGMAELISQRARFADLVVLPRPYGAGRGPAEEAVVEAALFEGQCAVLVMPDGMAEPPAFQRVVVAWNQSPEALSAIRRALPLLRKAAAVDITIIDPPVHGPERSDPGGMLSQWLSRHGVRAEVTVLARTLPRISDVLMRHVRDRDADLLVMGAYGHSRFREAILGGATRDLLETAEVPVFMAH
ncbi:MAG: universal stress protein [Gemmobacter sp.]|uniref:universal stress protein n=1 Tax=Gemmobacter sp. TaxID=1898957 RepID=UPI00391C423B